MSWLDGLRHRVRTLLRHRAHEQDLADEMRFHAELDTLQTGDPQHAAVRFGNVTHYREEVRRLTWYGWLDPVRQDVTYAWRSMRRTPGFTLTVVLTLALGIGINAATFAVLDLLYLHQPAGIEQPGAVRRFHIEHFNTGDGVPFTSMSVNYPMYRELTAAVGDSAAVALYTTDFALRMGTHPRDPRIRGVYASANYFGILGVRAALGRVYGSDEDRLGRGGPVAVVSDRFWRAHFAADSGVIGRVVDVEGVKYTVIGVFDAAFTGLDLQAVDVWMPLSTIPVPSWVSGPWWQEPNIYRFQTLYRLDPSISEPAIAKRATERMRAFNRRTRSTRPDTLMNVIPGPLNEARGPAKPGAELLISSRLSGVALVVLLIACANVVNLLLARAVRRRHEFSVRLMLGVSRFRLVRMMTVEALLLALVALIPALLAAAWGGAVLRALLLPQVEWYVGALTWRAALAAMAVALGAGLVAGIIPAVQASRPDLGGAFKASPNAAVSHRSRLRSALIVVQAALTLVLLTGSALFVRSLSNVQSIDIGFDAARLVYGRVEFARGEDPPASVMDAALRTISARLSGQGAIASASLMRLEPMQGISWVEFFTATDSVGTFEQRAPTVSMVSPSFFTTVGMQLLRGRTFGGSDAGSAPPEVIVNDAMARRLWPNTDAIGQCLYIKSRTLPCHTVVGVVENARQSSVVEDATYQFYLPLGSVGAAKYGSVIAIRTRGPTGPIIGELRRALHEAFPSGEPVVHAMLENLEQEYRPWKLGATLFTVFGMLALVVALIGIYGTVSYTVAQRTHELGIRIALGAQLRDVVRQVIGDGVRTVLAGTLIGVALALLAGRLVAAMLYGVAANDAITIAAVAASLLASAVIASLVPAMRATRVDPMTALRSE